MLKISQALAASMLMVLMTLPARADTLGQEYVFRDFSHGDRAYISQQRALVEDMIGRRYGSRFSGDITRDLALLQRLIDDKVWEPGQRKELQAMGVVLGDLLAARHKLEWSIYIDQAGRSRALRIDETSQAVFPLTMISRRYSVGAEVDLAKIIKKAARAVKRVRENAALY